MAPESADLVLASDVPDGEGDVLVLDGLDVEADGRDGGDDLTELELVEDGGLASSVETDHEDAALLLGAQKLRDPLSHVLCFWRSCWGWTTDEGTNNNNDDD